MATVTLSNKNCASLLDLTNAATLAWHCRSKLAGLWYAYELQRRHPELVVPVLHPGVIATDMNLPKARSDRLPSSAVLQLMLGQKEPK